MVGLRLFLPETWVGDPTRLERADVPAEYRSARTKSEIALAELDRLIAAGVRFGTVLADAGYGMGAEFRQALSARGLPWAVGRSSRSMLVWPVASVADLKVHRRFHLLRTSEAGAPVPSYTLPGR